MARPYQCDECGAIMPQIVKQPTDVSIQINGGWSADTHICWTCFSTKLPNTFAGLMPTEEQMREREAQRKAEEAARQSS